MKSWLTWFGGKYYILPEILPFPPHNVYIELFGGSGVVLLNKPPAKYEVLNDINGSLINAWLELKKSYRTFQEKGALELESRQIFNDYLKETADPAENAYRFFYRNRMSFSGKNDTFGGLKCNTDKRKTQISVFRTYLREILPIIHDRIQNVKFEQQSYKTLLHRLLRFDSEQLCIYADPPYYTGGEQYQKIQGGTPWKKEDFDELKTLLTQFQRTRIILSIDNPNFIDWNKQSFLKPQCSDNFSTIKNLRTEYIYRNYDPNKITHTKRKFQTVI